MAEYSGFGLWSRMGRGGRENANGVLQDDLTWEKESLWVEEGGGNEGLTRGSVCEEWGILFSVGSWGGASGR